MRQVPVSAAEKEEIDITGTRHSDASATVCALCVCACVRACARACVCIVGRTTRGFLTFCLQLRVVPDTGALWPLDYHHWEMGERER